MNLWLRLRKIPYSSKAYSGCGGDECGEREGKDVVFPEVSTKNLQLPIIHGLMVIGGKV